MAKKNRAQLVAALVALAVAESEYENLQTNAELEQLLKQKKAEQALQDSETVTDDETGTDDDTDLEEGGEETPEETDHEESSGTEDPEEEILEEGGEDEPDPEPESTDQKGDPDDDDPEEDSEDEGPGLTKMVARSGFSVQVLDTAVHKGNSLNKGETLKVAEGKTFYAGEKTRDHLLDYRAAERA